MVGAVGLFLVAGCAVLDGGHRYPANGKRVYYKDGDRWTPSYSPPERTYPTDPSAGGSATTLPTYVRNYRLYRTSDASPRGPGGKSAVGILVAIRGYSIGRCSVSHWTTGLVLTNAHCIKDTDRPENLYVVFWNASGETSAARVTAIENKGIESGVDAAFLRISDTDAARWDAFGGDYNDTSGLIGDSLGNDKMDVTIWAFDHKDGTTSDYSNLTLKHCLAVPRTTPKLVGIKSDGTEVGIVDADADEVYHLFYDTCDVSPQSGNSGSLVTDSSDRAVGVHWGSMQRSQLRDRYTDVKLTGASGAEVRLSTATDGAVYGSGAAIDYLLTYFHMN